MAKEKDESAGKIREDVIRGIYADMLSAYGRIIEKWGPKPFELHAAMGVFSTTITLFAASEYIAQDEDGENGTK